MAAVDDGTATRAHLDQQVELARERINSVEHAFAAATQDMAGVVRQIAKLRNAGDVFVENFAKYAGGELPSLREGLQGVCECLAAAEDHRQAHVSRIETQIIHPFTRYEKVCRLAKDGLKDRKAARDKEVSKQRVYDKVRRDHPNNATKISRALDEMQRARQEAAQVSRKAEEHMTAYEVQKLRDTKDILGDYLASSLAFHSKSLELMTIAYQNLKSVDEEEYLGEFRTAFHRRSDDRERARLRMHSLDGSVASASRSRESLLAEERGGAVVRTLSDGGTSGGRPGGGGGGGGRTRADSVEYMDDEAEDVSDISEGDLQ